jgi:hypothetical protein
MAIVNKQQLENAALDVVSIEEFANGSETLNGTGVVTSRLGQTYRTLTKIIADAEAAIAQIDAQAQNSANAAAESEGNAEQSYQNVLAIYGDTSAVVAAVDTATSAAQTATEQAGIATAANQAIDATVLTLATNLILTQTIIVQHHAFT